MTLYEDPKELFLNVYDANIKRAGADALLSWLKTSDFFEAPASTAYHLAQPQGLVQHSLHVYNRLHSLCQLESVQSKDFVMPDEETIAIVGLLHDICKVGLYKQVKKSRKTDACYSNGKPIWEDYIGYEHNDTIPYGHGEKSVYMISGFMKLSREEAMAIRWHMGFTDNDFKAGSRTLGSAFSMYPLAVLSHMADLSATYFDEQ